MNNRALRSSIPPTSSSELGALSQNPELFLLCPKMRNRGRRRREEWAVGHTDTTPQRGLVRLIAEAADREGARSRLFIVFLQGIRAGEMVPRCHASHHEARFLTGNRWVVLFCQFIPLTLFRPLLRFEFCRGSLSCSPSL